VGLFTRWSGVRALHVAPTAIYAQPLFTHPVTDFRIELGPSQEDLTVPGDEDDVADAEIAEPVNAKSGHNQPKSVRMQAAVQLFELDAASTPTGTLSQVRFFTASKRSAWDTVVHSWGSLSKPLKSLFRTVKDALMLLWDAEAGRSPSLDYAVRRVMDNLNMGRSLPPVYAFIQRGSSAPLVDITLVPFFKLTGQLNRRNLIFRQLSSAWENATYTTNGKSFDSVMLPSTETVPPSPQCNNHLLLLTRGVVSTRPALLGVKQFGSYVLTSFHALRPGKNNWSVMLARHC